jgi:hypothetical protein
MAKGGKAGVLFLRGLRRRRVIGSCVKGIGPFDRGCDTSCEYPALVSQEGAIRAFLNGHGATGTRPEALAHSAGTRLCLVGECLLFLVWKDLALDGSGGIL